MSEPEPTPPPVPNRLSSMPEAVPNTLSSSQGGGPAGQTADDAGQVPSSASEPPLSGDAGGSGQPETPPGRGGRRIGRSTIVTVVIIGALLVGGFLFRDRISGSAGDIQVGDCFMLPAASESQSESQVVEEVDHRPCTEAHDAEAFFVGDLEGAADATFPEASLVEDFVDAQCVPAFQAYTGSEFFSQAPLDAGYFSPTAESWRLADRAVMCYLTPVSGTTTQSYKGANP
jgi:hypothetical protein